MEKAIKIEKLSKAYQLGEFSTGTLSRDIERWWALLRGKEDPFLKIGEVNERTKGGNSNIVWSLKDINFEIERGSAVGIIGRNGAGKSTLLKILSRVTTPTTGVVKIKGRIASLLEVGTGFHPELTGRENIFLNGAILGMRKQEIKRKFDEIVDFAGVERYIDTPVKRYSSGMYVRLAFGVAAHLESEILIVDEVLAVGDSEFQKKCLGKMKDVSNKDGRTVLFVSHNMAAIKQLCSHGILLKNGQLQLNGDVANIVEEYLNSGITSIRESSWTNEDAPGNDKISIRKIAAYAKGKTTTDPIKSNEDIIVELQFENKMKNVDLDVTWDIFDAEAAHVCHVGTLVGNGDKVNQGTFKVQFQIPKNLLNTTRYYFNITFGINQRYVAFKYDNILSLDIEDGLSRQGASFHKYPGIIHPKFEWSVQQIFN
ncbi:ABC transporter ATP-binding protein [Longitalea luteola]|uniref:ABC transporter ATP-binding protein n=1 Tax=Longitalea luteola TaxID=2812563 RepID=UPI001A971EA7|nr:polysaccharide ABC transporter ATP-binding protein [Longitalea luteola]